MKLLLPGTKGGLISERLSIWLQPQKEILPLVFSLGGY
jgi:hypothetical protein